MASVYEQDEISQVNMNTAADNYLVPVDRNGSSPNVIQLDRLLQILHPADLPTPGEDLVGHIRNQSGHPFRCERRVHVDVTVTWTRYEPGDDISTLWGLDAGSRIFRGIHSNGNEIDTPLSTSVFVKPRGTFEQYSTAENTGWYWIAAPDGFQRVVNTRNEANHNVSANDQIWAWGDSLYVSSGYTAPATDHTYYVWEEIDDRDPVIITYMREDTARITPYSTDNYGVSGTRGILRWADTPAERYFGGDNDMIDVLTDAEGDALVGVDINIADRTGMFFQMAAGLWDFEMQIRTRNGARYFEYVLARVRSASDDEIIAVETQNHAAQAPNFVVDDVDYTETLIAPLIRVQDDDVFYVAVIDQQNIATNEAFGGYMKATKRI